MGMLWGYYRGVMEVLLGYHEDVMWVLLRCYGQQWGCYGGVMGVLGSIIWLLYRGVIWGCYLCLMRFVMVVL